MAGYKIFFKESVWKDLRNLPRGDIKKIMGRIEKLADEPRPMGCEKITAQQLYRIRQGSYRIVYSIQDDILTVWIVKVGHRKDVYRR